MRSNIKCNIWIIFYLIQLCLSQIGPRLSLDPPNAGFLVQSIRESNGIYNQQFILDPSRLQDGRKPRVTAGLGPISRRAPVPQPSNDLPPSISSSVQEKTIDSLQPSVHLINPAVLEGDNDLHFLCHLGSSSPPNIAEPVSQKPRTYFNSRASSLSYCCVVAVDYVTAGVQLRQLSVCQLPLPDNPLSGSSTTCHTSVTLDRRVWLTPNANRQVNVSYRVFPQKSDAPPLSGPVKNQHHRCNMHELDPGDFVLLEERPVLKREESTADREIGGMVSVEVPRRLLKVGDTLLVKVRLKSEAKLTNDTFTLRSTIRPKTFVNFVKLSEQTNMAWNVTAKTIIGDGANVTEITATLKKNSAPMFRVNRYEGVLFTMEFRVMPSLLHEKRVAPRIFWSLGTSSMTVVTRLNIESSKFRDIVGVVKVTNLVNTPVLTGIPVQHRLWIYGLTHDLELHDLTSSASCHSLDQDALALPDAKCGLIKMTGRERHPSLDGNDLVPIPSGESDQIGDGEKDKMSARMTSSGKGEEIGGGYQSKRDKGTVIVAKYQGKHCRLGLTMWLPQLPLSIRLVDPILNAVKGWRVPRTGDGRRRVIRSVQVSPQMNKIPYQLYNDLYQPRDDILIDPEPVDVLQKPERIPQTRKNVNTDQPLKRKKKKKSDDDCKRRFQHTDVTVLARFTRTSSPSLDSDYLGGGPDSYLDVTHLVHPRLRVLHAPSSSSRRQQAARLTCPLPSHVPDEDFSQTSSTSSPRCYLHGKSPGSGQVVLGWPKGRESEPGYMATANFSVTTDKVTVVGLQAQVVTDLSLTLSPVAIPLSFNNRPLPTNTDSNNAPTPHQFQAQQPPSPTHTTAPLHTVSQRFISTIEPIVGRHLQTPGQSRLISVGLQMSDGSVYPLTSPSVPSVSLGESLSPLEEDLFLSVRSLRPDLVRVSNWTSGDFLGTNSWPRVEMRITDKAIKSTVTDVMLEVSVNLAQHCRRWNTFVDPLRITLSVTPPQGIHGAVPSNGDRANDRSDDEASSEDTIPLKPLAEVDEKPKYILPTIIPQSPHGSVPLKDAPDRQMIYPRTGGNGFIRGVDKDKSEKKKTDKVEKSPSIVPSKESGNTETGREKMGNDGMNENAERLNGDILGPLGVGMYVLLGFFCMAALIFTVNCGVMALRQKKIYSRETRNEIVARDSNWVWVDGESLKRQPGSTPVTQLLLVDRNSENEAVSSARSSHHRESRDIESSESQRNSLNQRGDNGSAGSDTSTRERMRQKQPVAHTIFPQRHYQGQECSIRIMTNPLMDTQSAHSPSPLSDAPCAPVVHRNRHQRATTDPLANPRHLVVSTADSTTGPPPFPPPEQPPPPIPAGARRSTMINSVESSADSPPPPQPPKRTTSRGLQSPPPNFSAPLPRQNHRHLPPSDETRHSTDSQLAPALPRPLSHPQARDNGSTVTLAEHQPRARSSVTEIEWDEEVLGLDYDQLVTYFSNLKESVA